VYRNALVYKRANPLAIDPVLINHHKDGTITCESKPPPDMTKRAALSIQRILRQEFGDVYDAGKYANAKEEMKR